MAESDSAPVDEPDDELEPTNGRPSVNDFATRESRSLGGKRAAEKRRERARTVRDRLGSAAEEHAGETVTTLLEGMKAELPTSVITKPDGTIIEKGGRPDHRARLKAAELWMDQAFGRSPVEVTGADGGPLEVEHTSAAAARFLAAIDELATRHRDRDELPVRPALPSPGE